MITKNFIWLPLLLVMLVVRDAEELSESLSQIFGNEFNGLGIVDEGGNCFGKRQDDLCGRFDTGRTEKDNPLNQRVLSALIVEVESDDPCYPGEGKNISLQYASDDSHCGSCNQIDIEPKNKDRMESEVESKLGFRSQKSCLLDRLSCDSGAVTNSFRNPSSGRKIEQVAMDQLIQMVYRKQMALRGSNAPKSYVRRVSKQVALACVKHTLTRYWKFEESSISCLDASVILHCRICTLQETMIPSLLMVFDQELLVMKLCIKLNLEDQVLFLVRRIDTSHIIGFSWIRVEQQREKEGSSYW